MLWSDKICTSAICGHLPKFWKITDFCQTPWPEAKHPSMGDDHPPSFSERERRTIGSVVIFWCSVSHTTRISRHCSFIKLKFIRNICSSCGTLTEQVTHNPRFYCTLLMLCLITHLAEWISLFGHLYIFLLFLVTCIFIYILESTC